MITIKLLGGLGNQLFQWALGRALSEHTPVQYDLSWFDLGIRPYALNDWAIDVPIGAPGPHDIHVMDQTMHYRELPSDHTLLEGYWQSERYFEHIAQKIRWELKLRNYPAQGTPANDMAIKIGRTKCPVAMHIRRATDPVADTASYLGVLPMSYYHEALSRLPDDATTFIFSDDPAWCKEHLSAGRVVEGNTASDDLWLMSLCEHVIMANSSFSWWAAWLGADRRGGKVIAPKQWFAQASELERARDICPARWVRL